LATIRLRRDLASNWAKVDPVLAEGEAGYEIDTGRFKIGDGSARWSDLRYFTPGTPDEIAVSEQELLDHINSLEPHPIYDNGQSLYLLYQNAKV
jgi:hypothetical protein